MPALTVWLLLVVWLAGLAFAAAAAVYAVLSARMRRARRIAQLPPALADAPERRAASRAAEVQDVLGAGFFVLLFAALAVAGINVANANADQQAASLRIARASLDEQYEPRALRKGLQYSADTDYTVGGASPAINDVVIVSAKLKPALSAAECTYPALQKLAAATSVRVVGADLQFSGPPTLDLHLPRDVTRNAGEEAAAFAHRQVHERTCLVTWSWATVMKHDGVTRILVELALRDGGVVRQATKSITLAVTPNGDLIDAMSKLAPILAGLVTLGGTLLTSMLNRRSAAAATAAADDGGAASEPS